ncbi:hypothetical protein EST38_g11657 [Candolleomyces aberdarensis]|uniref:DUF4219 domain-containing protein n=1 Tax=Candolleomyces aberdarensis TaxID=2316362 RepID=A0A4Q2D4D2_9AGAR|nr:hypothetical protein EST38_g11657 [Candolleomyces aberdarensis]
MSSANTSMQASIPIFGSSNYRRWEFMMSSYLQNQSLWQIADGSYGKPEDPASDAEAAVKVAKEAEIRRWKADNDAALGTMRIKMREDFRNLTLGKTAAEVWKLLGDKYGKVTTSMKFAWFQELMKFQLHGTSHPQKELAHFEVLVSKLKEVKIVFDLMVLVMLIVMRLPEFYKNTIPLIIHDIKTNDLKMDDLKEYLQIEWE